MPRTKKIEKENKVKTLDEYLMKENFARTGCLLLDLVVGGGVGLGFPYGTMVNIVGDKSSGKTFLGWEILAANYHTYKDKLKFNYDGAEFGDTFNTEDLYGVDLQGHKNNANLTSEMVETFDGNTSIFLDGIRSVNQKGIYILDSLDGLSDKDKEDQEKKFKDMATKGNAKEAGSYNTGTASHLSKQYFRTKTGKLKKKNALLLIISQVREKIGVSFGKKHYRAGGKAMDFYAHTCLWLANLLKIKKNGRVVGVVVKAVTEKSKTPRPYRSCIFTIFFDYGVDDIGTSLDYLYDLRSEEGKLLVAANNIIWNSEDADGVEFNWDNLQEWVKSLPEYEDIREAKRLDTGKRNLSKSWLIDYIEQTPELKEKADEYFIQGLTRDELISRIEEDPQMKKELDRRVIRKWETEENAVLSGRRKKYQ
jgi:RecA/RadA recombinase